MSYTHDRTLLNKLGFADPDKKLPRHDLACQYLIQPHVVSKVLGKTSLTFDARTEFVISKGQDQYKQHIGFADALLLDVVSTCPEPHSVRSGVFVEEGPFMGPQHSERFVSDGFAAWHFRRTTHHETQYGSFPCGGHAEGAFLFEVKITPVTASDTLRQINLYREHLRRVMYERKSGGRENVGSNGVAYYVVVDFDLSPTETKILKDADIRVLRLGPDFDHWVAEREREAPAQLHAI